jgi:predicted nucleic acid-binding protein
MILIDSSVFIAMLRAGQDPAIELAPLSRQYDLATCGVVRCEVLRGMRTPKARMAMTKYFDCLLYIPALNPIWEDAEELLWSLDRKGCLIPLPDALIASCARKAGAAVLTYDKHFHHVPGLHVRNSPAAD